MGQAQNSGQKIYNEGEGEESWLSSNFSQILVALNGIVITLTAYAILNIFIQGILKDEYEQVTKDTVNAMAEGFSDLEHTMKNLSTILLLSKTSNPDEIAKQIRLATPSLNMFDQFLWVYETQSGVWSYSTIYMRTGLDRTRSVYTLVPDQKFLSNLVNSNVLYDEFIHVVNDFEGMEYMPSPHDPKIKNRSFAMLKAVQKGSTKAGILIGVTRMEHVMGQEWLAKLDLLSDIIIRDLNNGHPIYKMERYPNSSTDQVELSQSFDFLVGQTRWEVIIRFLKVEYISFLERVPFLILFFGGVLSAVGTFYVRGKQKQSRVLTKMNKALEQKNFELSSEISERERLNKALRRAERDNRAIIDSVTDIIFECNTEGKILFLNTAWQKITGFDLEQGKGNDLFSFMHPQDQEQQRQDFELLVQGQKHFMRSFTRLRSSDGTFRSVEMSLSLMSHEESKKTRIVGTFTDVEERRRAERALSEAEKKYRTIVENAAGGIYQLTPEGLYLAANPAMARILGYVNREEVVRVNANEKVYVDQDRQKQFRDKLEAEEVINNHETQVYKKDGEKIWINENVRVVKDDNGNTLYYEGSIEDITQRKQAEIGLKDAKIQSDIANRAKSDFIANMSHELRTPLNHIIGFSEVIHNQVLGPLDNQEYLEYASNIHESGKDLLHIINEILDISKIEAGERQLNDSMIDIKEIIDLVISLLREKAEVHSLTLANKISDIPRIVAEELAVKQVFMNIIANAIKYTPNGGSVTISYDKNDEGEVLISVTDTGIGLDPQEIDKALSPFGQLNNDLNRSDSGTGLGLTLVDSIMRLHGGRVELFSEKGIGTTATVIFPADRVPENNSKEKKDDKIAAGHEQLDAAIENKECDEAVIDSQIDAEYSEQDLGNTSSLEYSETVTENQE